MDVKFVVALHNSAKHGGLLANHLEPDYCGDILCPVSDRPGIAACLAEAPDCRLMENQPSNQAHSQSK